MFRNICKIVIPHFYNFDIKLLARLRNFLEFLDMFRKESSWRLKKIGNKMFISMRINLSSDLRDRIEALPRNNSRKR